MSGATNKRWSEFLLPAVRGASGGGSNSGSDRNTDDDDGASGDYFREEAEGEEEGGGRGEDRWRSSGGHRGVGGDGGSNDDDGHGSVWSLRSHLSFKSLPSYMRAKSGVEADPDRVRPRWEIVFLCYVQS